MSYQTAKWVQPKWVFTWWLVDNTPNLSMNDKFSPYLRNARIKWQSIENRKWYEPIIDRWYNEWDATLWIWHLWDDRVLFFTKYAHYSTWEPVNTLCTVDKEWTQYIVNVYWNVWDWWDRTGVDWLVSMLKVSNFTYMLNNKMQITKVGDYFFDAKLRCWATSKTLSEWQAVTNWAFKISFDGNPAIEFVWLDFSWMSFSNIANHIEDKIREVTGGEEECNWRTDHFEFESDNKTIDSYVSKPVFYDYGYTDLSWPEWLNADDSTHVAPVFYRTTMRYIDSWIVWFSPWFSVDFNGSHWASWSTVNWNKVYKSVAGDYDDFTWAWSDVFSFDENITWLIANNQWLFYFTKNTISVTGTSDIQETWGVYSYITRKLQVQEWAANHHSIVSSWKNVYYLSSSNSINRLERGANIDWFETLDLSWRENAGIENIMKTLDADQSKSCWQFYPEENIIKRYLKSEWADANDTCIIYDITNDWFLVDTNIQRNWWIYLDWINYVIPATWRWVQKDEVGYDDNWAAIDFEYRTKEFYITDPTYTKILRETRTLLDMNLHAEIKQQIWLDWKFFEQKWYTGVDVEMSNWSQEWWPIWETPIWELPVWAWWDSKWIEERYEMYILRTKWNLNKKWKKIQFRYVMNVVDWKVKLKWLSMLVEQLNWLATNLTP